MLALYRSGRQAEALEVYHDARRALVDELGHRAEPGLQQLHARDPAPGALARAGGASPAPARRRTSRRSLAALLAGRLVPVLGARRDRRARGARSRERFDYRRTSASDARPRRAVRRRSRKGRAAVRRAARALRRGAAPTPVHRFSRVRCRRCCASAALPHQLLVTTSYDLALEQALLDAGEEFDVVSYLASGRDRGRSATRARRRRHA